MKYVYVYTADADKFERLNKAAKIKNAIFCVNDIESIAYLREKYNIKALNIDAVIDLVNLLEMGDEVYLCTPEDIKIIKASFKAKEIC